MAKSDDFTTWLSFNSVNGYTDCIQINVLKDSIYTIGFYISEKLSDEFRHAYSFKYISSLLHCKKISGVKQPIPNTSEEMNVLTVFYQKNGFKNLPNNKICYIFTEKE